MDMNMVGMTIRKVIVTTNGKILNPTKRNLRKQIWTLHQKMKKRDKGLKTDYVIEKDDDRNSYHVHLLIKYNNPDNLNNQLKRFVGGNTWTTDWIGLKPLKINQGKYGEIRVHEITDEVDFRNRYMNKHDPSESLF
jgi:hypothetical protein